MFLDVEKCANFLRFIFVGLEMWFRTLAMTDPG
jgi:hypothetical protein